VAQFDIFLAHNSKDKEIVRALKQRLEQRQLKVWVDEDEIPPGGALQKHIEDGLLNSTSIAVLVGKTGLGPTEVEEMAAAIALATKDNRRVVPVLLPGYPESAQLPLFLSNRRWIDQRAGLTDQGIDDLVWAAKGVKPRLEPKIGSAPEPLVPGRSQTANTPQSTAEILAQQLAGLWPITGLDETNISRAFNLWRPRGMPLLPARGDAHNMFQQAVNQLGQSVRQGKDGWFPLVEFVRELTRQCAAGTRGSLEDLFRDAVQQLVDDAAEQQQLLANPPEPPPERRHPADYVLVRFAEQVATTSEWLVQAWSFYGNYPQKLFPEPRPITRSDFPTLVQELWDVILALELDEKQITVAFMLPTALLCEQQLDQEQVANWGPFGSMVKLVLRPSARLPELQAKKLLQRRWQEWRSDAQFSLTIDEFPETATKKVARAVWITAQEASRRFLVKDLHDCTARCVVMLSPPVAKDESSRRKLLEGVLAAGVPVVLWLRAPAGSDSETARQHWVAVLKDVTCADLPDQIRKWREDAAQVSDEEQATAVGSCLTLIVDDADHPAPDADPRLPAEVLR